MLDIVRPATYPTYPTSPTSPTSLPTAGTTDPASDVRRPTSDDLPGASPSLPGFRCRPWDLRLPTMAHFAAPSLPLSSLSPVSPVAPASTASSGGNPAGAAAPPSTSARGGPGSGPSPSATTPLQPVQPSPPGTAPAPAQAPQQPRDQQQQPPPQPQPEPPRYRPPNPPQHKRVYQACIPCRRRKVRCDLGSVDDPHDPPCVRCRRESKECFFSATRRKRKADEDDPELEEYILRNGRKQARGASVTLDRRYYSDMPLPPHGRAQSSRRMGESAKSVRSNSSAGGEFGNGEPNTPLENLEARTGMRREVYGPHDALDLLYKAATDKLVFLSTLIPGCAQAG